MTVFIDLSYKVQLWGAIFGIVVHFWYLLLALIKIDNQYVLGVVKMIIDQVIIALCL